MFIFLENILETSKKEITHFRQCKLYDETISLLSYLFLIATFGLDNNNNNNKVDLQISVSNFSQHFAKCDRISTVFPL